MKNILHLIETSGPGGAEKVLISLVDHLDRKRYKSIICLLKDGWLNAELQRRGFKTVIIPQGRFIDIKWIYKLITLMRAHNIQLIHSHEFTMNTYGCLVSLVMCIPLIATIHGKGYYSESLKRRMAYRFLSRHAAKLVTVSLDIKNFLEERVGINANNISPIYNGVSVQEVANGELMQLRNDLAIRCCTQVIGTVGNLYPVKGHTYLLKAAANIVGLFPDACFLIAGRGELLHKLQEEINDLKISKNVRLLGFRDDIPVLLRLMDVFVLPSLSEGISIALLEAMAARKPAIATRVGGNPEVIVEDETGFLVPAANVGALTDKLSFLLKDKDRARTMGELGRRRVEQRFSLDRMVEKYEEVYEDCLAR